MCLQNTYLLHFQQKINFLSIWLSSFGHSILLILLSFSIFLNFYQYLGFLLQTIEWSQTFEVPLLK